MVFFRCNAQLTVKAVVPNLLYIVPVGDDTGTLDRVLQRKNTAL